MTAAPMRPAAPSWAACVDAALLVVAGLEVDDPEEEPLPVELRDAVVAGKVEVVSSSVEMPVELNPLGVVAPAVVGVDEPEPEPEELQVVTVPPMRKGAEETVLPVLSRSERTTFVPDGILTRYVRELADVGGKVTMG